MGLQLGFLNYCILLFTICSHITYVSAHVCLQDALFDVGAVMAGVTQDYAATYPTAANTLPIRLKVDMTYLDNDALGRTCNQTGQSLMAGNPAAPYTCQSKDVVTSALKSYLAGMLDRAQKLFERTLLVMPVQTPLRLQSSSQPQGLYGGVWVTGDYVTGLPSIDMVMFVTARPILSNPGDAETLAVATVVQEDQFGRPILGHLNINPGGIDQASSRFAYNFGVVIHEMTHSLGFTNYKFSRALNPVSGQPDLNLLRTVTLNVGAGDIGDSRSIIASPRVVSWARNYFDCATIEGVEIENQGGGGTEGSHWEKRVVYNEYMTGTASRNPVFSELTLSLLEDTGWYRANYSNAQSLLWGQGMGCSFALRSCPSWPRYEGYFCTEHNKQGCTADYQAKGACILATTTSDVETKYRYFSDPRQVGATLLADYCPVTLGYDNGWCFDTSQGGDGLFQRGEVFGENSRCFGSSLMKNLPVGGSNTNICYETYCTAPEELRVKIGDYWYECPPSSDIRVIGYGGTLTCPTNIGQICSQSANDSTWPSFLTISPNAGGPGLRVNITGRNFIEGVTVRIDDPLEDIVVVSDTLITAKIPSSDRFKNPTNIIEQKESVIITDTKGRTTVGYNKFTIKVGLNSEFFANALEYLGDNWLITASLAAAIVVTCCVCGYCCYRQKGKAEEADTEYYEQ